MALKMRVQIYKQQQSMQIQKTGPQETHNLLLTTFLPSQQIKYLAFIRMDAPKVILHNNMELRFVTGMIAATTNTIKLYSIYQNATAFEIGSWRLHEDITGIAGWDRIIVVNTTQKIVGFRYEGGVLKNAFLISLEFLHLDDQDACTVFADKMGYYLVIHIRNYLILCFSQTLAAKYRARVQEKFKVGLVSDDVRWNEPSKDHVLDLVKIKLVDLEINKIEQIQIIDETIYFIGHKGKEKTLYYVHVRYFFQTLESSQAVTAAPQKDQVPQNSNVIIFHPHLRAGVNREPDFLYYNYQTHKVSLKSQQTLYDVGTFDGKIELFHQGSSLFPILLWQKQKNKLSLIEKYKTFQQNYQFKVKQLSDNSHAEILIYREGIVVFASLIGLYLLTPNGCKEKIHNSIGNIIDFHIGKDMLLIQNYEKKGTKLYELTKGPKVDPKPFVTHKKKMFLEDLSDLNAIYSLVIGRKKIQILAARRGNGVNRMYTFYKESANQFECISDDIKDYEEAEINGENILLVQTKAEASLTLVHNQQGFTFEPFSWSGWKLPKRWCQFQYLIAYDENETWFFYNILTKKETKIQFSKARANENHTFIQFRNVTHDKTLKDHDLIEIYFCYKKEIHIWLLDLTIREINLIHISKALFQGCPILSNELVFPESHTRDIYRSITCPQYNLNDHGIRTLVNSLGSVIVAAYLYQWKGKTLLIMVNNDEGILIYRKYFNVEDGGFIFRRINTPLNIVKNFKWGGEKSFIKLGQGIIKFGNVFIYKGELVESIAARSLFKMEGMLWGLLGEGKIRLIHLGNDVYEGFCIRQIQSGITEQLMGIDSTSQYYCVFSRKSFEIFGKDFNSHWRCTLGNETIVCLRMFEHYIGMSYYDYYCDEEGVNDYNSVRFRFRIYNCATKNKIIERQKPLDEPILHIRYMAPDKLILVTSSLIFVNVLKNDKTLELYRTHNFSSKRSFLSAFSYIPDILPSTFGAKGSPGCMLFGGSHGGLGFFVGKWIEEQKLKQQWFEGYRCGIRQVSFFHFSEERDELLKALIADEDGNLIVLTLKPDHAQKLADIRLGSVVNTFKTKSGNQRAVYCSLSDGSIKLLTAVKLESCQDSYLDFQKSFCKILPFYGGFNLRASRRLLQKYRSGRLVSRGNVVDGDILECFFSLTNTLKIEILSNSDMEISPLSILPF